MKTTIKGLLVLVILFTIVSCNAQQQDAFSPKEVYKSKDLIITQVAPNSFVHTSFLQTNDFGNVPCNGLIVRNSKETIIFDTPTNNESSEELIRWVNRELNCKVNAIIPTHFHNDCLAGLQAFNDHNIPSYAHVKTIALAKENDFVIPQNGFSDSLTLSVGNEIIMARYFGEGHTRDNIVGYFPSENVMFGGCLIKEMNASKGFLGDANVEIWSSTVEDIKKRFPAVEIVVPGHGNHGDRSLLDYTIKLFNTRHFGDKKLTETN
ncbi:subclass B1 metallo-beta-lactamase [Aquiflexum sp. LQ15W]|uniref:subclass B1 metallo-beta-lactamase n=1 Tax=Cognataquiflexum nitidum TaxID=2922272 RepID=UPI001F12D1BB|nr:subclass B1 metallo-beta-lactamase [Cognataquiflexum nitidum]MCH6199764.1 subclass B1 metallo-beta-lactamase [Cognataquiflexum nitidum]